MRYPGISADGFLDELRAFFEQLAEQPVSGWTTFEHAISLQRYPRGSVIFDQAAPDRVFRLVRTGLVQLQYLSLDGRQHTKSIVGEGKSFASLVALEGGTTTFSASALTDTEVIAVPYAALQARMQADPIWERVARKLLTEQAMRKERREFELLTLSAAERWRRLLAERPELIGRARQAALAGLIGVTPVALSRLKARLRRTNPSPER